MNSDLIPLLYPLQPGYKDDDKWIDQIVNNAKTINWQAAFEDDVIVMDVINSDGSRPFYPKMAILKKF